MELPIGIKTAKTLFCADCKHADKAVNPKEKYCRLRHEVVRADAKACRSVGVKPPEKPVQKEEKKPEKAVQKPPPERTIYVWVPNMELAGRLIGREGRNIRCLELLTDTDIQISDRRWAAVTGHPTDVKVAAVTIWDLVQGEGRVYPNRIRDVLLDRYSKESVEDLQYFRNRLQNPRYRESAGTSR